LGTVTAQVEGMPPRVVGPANLTGFPGIGASSAINMPLFTGPAANALWNVVRASGSGRALRVKLGGPTKTDTMPDGRELRIELSPGNGGSARVAAFYVDNKLTALSFFTYGGESSQRIATSMDVIHFDKAGAAAGITKYDLTVPGADLRAISRKALGAAAGLQTLSGEYCETQIETRPLIAWKGHVTNNFWTSSRLARHGSPQGSL
jgi:hypothetical protein